MDINKVDLNIGQKNANPFKTTRKSNTNPFEYKNFEGNTLQFADVFEGFNSKNISFKGNKLKMISSSVMGSMTKLHHSITEPIVNFVNKVKSAWEYASHTNITDAAGAGIKNLKEGLSNIGIVKYGKNVSEYIGGLGDKLSDRLSFLNRDIIDIGHDLTGAWTALISKASHSKIPAGLTVEEYRGLWIKENELAAKEIALNSEHITKAKVA